MIFCVEDDADIRDLMIYTLNAAGYEAKGFADGQQLHEALKTQTPRRHIRSKNRTGRLQRQPVQKPYISGEAVL